MGISAPNWGWRFRTFDTEIAYQMVIGGDVRLSEFTDSHRLVYMQTITAVQY